MAIRECPVESSAISGIKYDDEKKRLFVTFQSGSQYVYFGVSGQRFASLCKAPSKGRYFQSAIRNSYQYARQGSRAKYESRR